MVACKNEIGRVRSGKWPKPLGSVGQRAWLRFQAAREAALDDDNLNPLAYAGDNSIPFKFPELATGRRRLHSPTIFARSHPSSCHEEVKRCSPRNTGSTLSQVRNCLTPRKASAFLSLACLASLAIDCCVLFICSSGLSSTMKESQNRLPVWKSSGQPKMIQEDWSVPEP